MWLIQAAPPQPSSFPFDLVEKLSGAVIALLFFWGLWRRWFVMGQDYEEMKSERDWWRSKWELDHARKELPPRDE